MCVCVCVCLCLYRLYSSLAGTVELNVGFVFVLKFPKPPEGPDVDNQPPPERNPVAGQKMDQS